MGHLICTIGCISVLVGKKKNMGFEQWFINSYILPYQGGNYKYLHFFRVTIMGHFLLCFSWPGEDNSLVLIGPGTGVAAFRSVLNFRNM